MRTAWPKIPLAGLLVDGQLSYGIVQPGSDHVGGVPIVRVKDLVGGRIDTRNPLHVAPSVSSKHSRTVVAGGELLLSIVGTIGESAVVPRTLAGWNVARAIAVIRPAGVSARWLQLCLQTTSARRAMSGVLNTTVQSTLNLADLKRVPVPVPPARERQAIENVFKALDDKIAANSGVVAVLSDLATAHLAASLDGSHAPISALATLTMGASPPGESYNERGEGLPFYQGVRDFGVRFPQRRVWTSRPTRLASAGDALLSVRAPVGSTNRAVEDLCLGRGVAGLRSRSDKPMTLFHQMRALGDQWAPFEAVGTVFGAINKAQLSDIPVPTVNPELAEGLERRLAALESRIDAALREDALLARTRDELLPLLMSGKVRVKDAENFAEEVL